MFFCIIIYLMVYMMVYQVAGLYIANHVVEDNIVRLNMFIAEIIGLLSSAIFFVIREWRMKFQMKKFVVS